MGGAAGFGGQDHQALSGAVGAGPGVAVEGEVAHQVVAVVLGAVTGAADTVFGPPGAEVGVLDGQFADELGEVGIVGVGRGSMRSAATASRASWPIPGAVA